MFVPLLTSADYGSASKSNGSRIDVLIERLPFIVVISLCSATMIAASVYLFKRQRFLNAVHPEQKPANAGGMLLAIEAPQPSTAVVAI